MLLPFECSLLPFVDEADGQDTEEDHHRPEAEPAHVAEGDGPGEEEGHFEVEDDKEDRHRRAARGIQ